MTIGHNLTLDQLINHAVNHAKRVLVGKNDVQLEPIFHIQFKDRPPAIINAPWHDEREKSAFIQALRQSMKQFRESIVNYSLLSEAWIAAEDQAHPSGLPPADREDKREVVLISASEGENFRILVLEIKRDAEGRVVELTDDDKFGQDGRFRGRLFNLLEDEDES